MRVRKTGIVLAVALAIGVMPFNAMAAQYQTRVSTNAFIETPTPYYEYLSEAGIGTTVSGTTVTSSLSASTKDMSKKISGTLSLQKYTSGRWATVAAWSVSGTGSINVDKVYTHGIEGVDYRSKAVLTIGTEKVTILEGSEG